MTRTRAPQIGTDPCITAVHKTKLDLAESDGLCDMTIRRLEKSAISALFRTISALPVIVSALVIFVFIVIVIIARACSHPLPVPLLIDLLETVPTFEEV